MRPRPAEDGRRQLGTLPGAAGRSAPPRRAHHTAGKAASTLVGETVGWIPVAGWLLKGAASGCTAFAMGVAAVNYFEKKYPAREAVPFETVSIKDWVKAALAHLGFKSN